MEGKPSRGKSSPARAHRLAVEAAFREVIEKGRRWESQDLKVFILDGKEGPGRLGVVAARKLGGSVKTNRFKRRVREAMRLHPAFTNGVRVVVVAKQGALNLRYAKIANQLDGALRTGEKK